MPIRCRKRPGGSHNRIVSIMRILSKRISSFFRPLVYAVIAAAVLMGVTAWAQAPLPPEVEDPECLGLNKQPAHATLMPYANLKEALVANRQASPYCRSLNGMWKFNLVTGPSLRPVDFYKTNFDASGWKEISVPSCWQMQGYGTPIYRNFGYTFQKNWPHVLTEPPTNYTAVPFTNKLTHSHEHARRIQGKGRGPASPR